MSKLPLNQVLSVEKVESFGVFLIKRMKCVTDIGEATWTVSSKNDFSGNFLVEHGFSVISIKFF